MNRPAQCMSLPLLPSSYTVRATSSLGNIPVNKTACPRSQISLPNLRLALHFGVLQIIELVHNLNQLKTIQWQNRRSSQSVSLLGLV